MDIFQMDAEFYLVKDSEKIALTTEEMIALEDPNGYNLLIELYNTEGEFLADMVITPDMFSSELIEDTVEDIGQAEEVIKKQEPLKVKPQKTIKTIKGGKLPNTSGNYTEGILAGLALITVGVGGFLFRKRKVKYS